MTLLLEGMSYRDIHARTRASHSTIAKARKALNAHGIGAVHQLDGIDDQTLAALIGDGRQLVTDEYASIDMDAVINARIGRNKTPLRVLWSNYLEAASGTTLRLYSYERFRQLVAAETATRGVTVRIAHTPGHTMQVDWAGSKMYVTDPITKKRSKVSIFVASLPYSGLVFAHGFANEKQPCWLEGHRLAFAYFGGVTSVIVPDNASTASNQISRTERTRHVNQRYEEFLEFYQTAALPTNPVRPKEKGNVESGVKVATNWCIKKLSTTVFADLDELNAAVAREIEMINNRRPFRNQALSRRDIFDQFEACELAPLPATEWVDVIWKQSKVAPDWHITIETVKYSVPYRLVGTTVTVRIRGNTLDVFANNELVATHKVSQQRGAYVTDLAHCPPGMANATHLWTPQYFLNQAGRVGPFTQAVIGNLLDAKPITAQAFQPARNILNMGKTPENKQVLEQACKQLLSGDVTAKKAVSYTAVKNMMAAVRAQSNRLATQLPTPRHNTAVDESITPDLPIRSQGMLGGVEQFRLGNLTSKGRNQ